jgi:predicted transcriptional regulator
MTEMTVLVLLCVVNAVAAINVKRRIVRAVRCWRARQEVRAVEREMFSELR